jgi:hypothetical protein
MITHSACFAGAGREANNMNVPGTRVNNDLQNHFSGARTNRIENAEITTAITNMINELI